MFVVEKEGAGGLLTIVTGRLVTRELQAVELDLQFRDGYFKNAVLAKAVEDIKGEGQGYALPLFAQHTQLPAEFLGVLAFSDIEAPF